MTNRRGWKTGGDLKTRVGDEGVIITGKVARYTSIRESGNADSMSGVFACHGIVGEWVKPFEKALLLWWDHDTSDSWNEDTAFLVKSLWFFHINIFRVLWDVTSNDRGDEDVEDYKGGEN